MGSARALERLCRQHDAYRWICGGVSVNHYSLSNFRVAHVEFLDKLLTESVAVLMQEGLVSMKRVSQDGIRVRASAGASSFRRKTTLESRLEEPRQQVETPKRELDTDPAATDRRQEEARRRAARERQKRFEDALARMPEAEARKKKSRPPKRKPSEDDEQFRKRSDPRVSTTDPEATVMKMADGGFCPAYNGQFAVDTETQVVTAWT